MYDCNTENELVFCTTVILKMSLYYVRLRCNCLPISFTATSVCPLNCNSIFSWRTLLMLVIHQEYLHSFCSLKWLVSENHKNEFSAQHYRFASLAVSIMPELCCFGKLPVHYFLSMQ